MSHFLLVLSCSITKIENSGLIPAINRYNGPYYQSLRKLSSAGKIPKSIDIFVISAKYGLIDIFTEIDYYDRRMTKERAKELNSEILKKLDTKLQSIVYSEIFINLGKDYLPAIAGIENLTKIKPQYATGGIGTKRKQMIEWVLSHN